MRIPAKACEDLRKALLESGIDATHFSDSEVEELGLFLLNLTAAAIKTRERCRLMGVELPSSHVEPEDSPTMQNSIPGLLN